ncbi:hypothetical protein HOH45_05275 [bacterium]|nr:hypothetical protein [bacterium]
MSQVHIVSTDSPSDSLQDLLVDYGRDQILFICPDHISKSSFIRSIQRYQPTGILPSVETLKDVVSRFLGKTDNFSVQAKLILIKTCLNEIKLVGNFWNTSGFYSQFIHVLHLLESNLIDLISYKEWLDGQSGISRDIYPLMDLFLKKKTDLGYVTSADLFSDVSQYEGRLGGAVSLVVLYGFFDIKPYEAQVFKKLFFQPQLYFIQDSYSFISTYIYEQAKHTPVQIEPLQLTADEVIKEQECLRFHSVYEETGYMVKEICRLVAEDNVVLDDVAIVVGHQHGYRELLETWFNHLGLFTPVQSVDIDQTPIFMFVSSFLTIVSSDFSLDSVSKFLYTPLVKSISVDGAHKPVRPEVLEQLAPILKLNTKNEFWVDVLNKMSEGDDLFSGVTDEIKSFIDSHQSMIFEQISIVNVIYGWVNEFKNCQTPHDYLEQLKQVSDLFGVLDLLSNRSEEMDEQGINSFVELMECIETFISNYLRINGSDVSKNCSGEDVFLGELGLFLNEIALLRDPDLTLDTILVSPQQAYYLNKPFVFIPGCIEGGWPWDDEDLHFFPKEARCLSKQKSSFLKSKNMFAHLLMSDHVMISFPLFINNVETIPSQFIPDTFSKRDIDTGVMTKKGLFLSKFESLSAGAVKKNKDEVYVDNINEDSTPVSLMAGATKQANQSLVYSVSQLETYQKCPHLYYYRYILKEIPFEDGFEEISASQWGIVIHHVCYEIFKQMKESHKAFSYKSEEHAKEIKEFVTKIATDVFESYEKPSFYWAIKKVILFGDERHPGLIDEFIRTEQNWTVDVEPILFEFSFGKQAPHSVQLSKDDMLNVTGQIDCVLESKNGELVILDYKTGSVIPTAADIKTMRNLQLSLYYLVLKSVYPEKSLVGGIFYQLKDAEKVDKKIVFSKKEAKKELFGLGRERPFEWKDDFDQTVKDHLRHVKYHIQDGFFSPDSHDILPEMKSKRPFACKFCPYTIVCRYKGRFN